MTRRNRAGRLRKIIYVVLGALLYVALGELLLRVIPNDASTLRVKSLPDRYVGAWYAPGDTLEIRTSCYEIDGIAINDLGLRMDRNVDAPKERYRIGVFGGSFVAALQVDDHEHLCALLQDYLPDAEILNFGHDGFNTIQKYVSYLKHGQNLGLDLVVLAMFLEHDVKGNSKALAAREPGGNPFRPWMVRDGRGYRVEYAKETQLKKVFKTVFPLHYKIYRHVYVYRMLYNKFITKLPGLLSGKNKGPAEAERPENENTLWSEAWDITEQSILMFREAAEKKGAKFVLAVIPTYGQLSGGKEEAGLPGLAGIYHGLDQPLAGLRAFAQEEGIGSIDFGQGLESYALGHQLPEPYFSYGCDLHFNPLGHYVMANELARFFAMKGMVGGKVEKRALANLEKSPREVLGEHAWKDIFEGGVYKGGSETARR